MKRAPEPLYEKWKKNGVLPRNIDREIVEIMHRTHMGVDLIELQKILGHVSLLTTARYTHLTTENHCNSYHKINALFDAFDIKLGNGKILLAQLTFYLVI